MKNFQLFALLLALFFGNSMNAQKYQKAAGIKNTNVQITKIWSDWIAHSDIPQLQVHYKNATGSTVEIEVKNVGTSQIYGEVTANRCAAEHRDYSEWKVFDLQAGASQTLSFVPVYGCADGTAFQWWTRSVHVWSDWFELQPDNFITCRWVKFNSELVVELRNNSSIGRRANFWSNICEVQDYKKRWNNVQLPPNKTIQLRANVPNAVMTSDGTDCVNGFFIWYSDIKQYSDRPTLFGG